MIEIWMQAALWLALALIATLLAIWLRVATALQAIPEFVVLITGSIQAPSGLTQLLTD